MSEEKSDTKQCPFCAEDIKIEAIKCKHCGAKLVKSSFDKALIPAIIILVILASVSIYFYVKHKQKQAEIIKRIEYELSEECKTDCMERMKKIATGLEMYATDNDGDYPPIIARLTDKITSAGGAYLRPGFLNCPGVGEEEYLYKCIEYPDDFVIECRRHNLKYAPGKGFY